MEENKKETLYTKLNYYLSKLPPIGYIAIIIVLLFALSFFMFYPRQNVLTVSEIYPLGYSPKDYDFMNSKRFFA